MYKLRIITAIFQNHILFIHVLKTYSFGKTTLAVIIAFGTLCDIWSSKVALFQKLVLYYPILHFGYCMCFIYHLLQAKSVVIHEQIRCTPRYGNSLRAQESPQTATMQFEYYNNRMALFLSFVSVCEICQAWSIRQLRRNRA